MPSDTNEANQCIFTCQNGITSGLYLCLIDLDRETIEEFIEKENIRCSFMTVKSKILNELRSAEKRRTICLKISVK